MFTVLEIARRLPSWYRVHEDEDILVVRCICCRFEARYAAHAVRIEEVFRDTLDHDRKCWDIETEVSRVRQP